MKKTRILFLLLAGVLLLAGCQKEGFRENGTGTDIEFGASTSSVVTKTAYSGDVYSDEGSSYERIDWVSGDVIRIYSNEAKHRYNQDQNWSDYKVISITDPTDRFSKASVGPNDGNGLVWGDPGTYHFYGVYPSSATASAGDTGFSFSGTIAANQGQWNASANKLPSYGYMSAAATQTVSEDDEEAPKISLDFYPEFTAFTFDLKSKDRDVTITKFELISEEDAIAGPFTVTYGSSKNYSFSSATDKIVSLSFANGTTISTERNLQFSVFALPRDLSKLAIRLTILSDDPTQTQTHTLKLKKKVNGEMQYMTFPACGKYNFTGIQMESTWSFKTITLEGEVIEWKEIGVDRESDNLPQSSQFEVVGARNVYSDLHPESAEARSKYRQTWVVDPNGSPVTVVFKIFSPVEGKYKITPQGATRSFEVTGDLTGEISGRGEQITTVKFSIAALRGARPGEEVYVNVVVTNVDGESFSLDSEAQLFDNRGYHKFRIDDPLE